MSNVHLCNIIWGGYIEAGWYRRTYCVFLMLSSSSHQTLLCYLLSGTEPCMVYLWSSSSIKRVYKKKEKHFNLWLTLSLPLVKARRRWWRSIYSPCRGRCVTHPNVCAMCHLKSVLGGGRGQLFSLLCEGEGAGIYCIAIVAEGVESTFSRLFCLCTFVTWESQVC